MTEAVVLVYYISAFTADSNITWALLGRATFHVSLQRRHIFYCLAEFLTVCTTTYCFIKPSYKLCSINCYRTAKTKC
jgi:hypothetical protein